MLSVGSNDGNAVIYWVRFVGGGGVNGFKRWQAKFISRWVLTQEIQHVATVVKYVNIETTAICRIMYLKHSVCVCFLNVNGSFTSRSTLFS